VSAFRTHSRISLEDCIYFRDRVQPAENDDINGSTGCGTNKVTPMPIG